MALAKFAVKIEVSVDEPVTEGSFTGGDRFQTNASTRYTLTGTGAGVATKQWNDYRTIATAGNDDLDLSGSLENRNGVAFVLTNLKVVYIKFISGTGTLTIGGGTAPVLGISGVLNVGEQYCYNAGTAGIGKTVTATTADILRIASSADNAVYEICLGGV